MIKRIKLLIVSCLSLGVLLVPAVTASVSAADIQNNLCGGTADLSLDSTTDCDTATTGSAEGLNTLITNIVNIFSVIVGIIAVVMIIIGGFRYITSGGDSGNVTGAKNTILYAIVGLVIVALAQFIVKFVLAKATGATG